MALFNHATKEVTAKLVYYGPGLCGKTTNLQWIHSNLAFKSKGKLVSLATQTDRTLFFDFLPIELGKIRGMRTRMQLYTVPGQVFYEATRRMVLKGCDAVVFVADSQAAMIDANFESLQSLRKNLLANEIDPSVPMVLQYNKRDLPTALPVSVLNARLNPRNVPYFEAVAVKGTGVEETLRGVTKALFRYLSDYYAADRGADGATEAPEAPATTTAPSTPSTVKITVPDPAPPNKAPGRPTVRVRRKGEPEAQPAPEPAARPEEPVEARPPEKVEPRPAPPSPPREPPSTPPTPPAPPGPEPPAAASPAAPEPRAPGKEEPTAPVADASSVPDFESSAGGALPPTIRIKPRRIVIPAKQPAEPPGKPVPPEKPLVAKPKPPPKPAPSPPPPPPPPKAPQVVQAEAPPADRPKPEPEPDLPPVVIEPEPEPEPAPSPPAVKPEPPATPPIARAEPRPAPVVSSPPRAEPPAPAPAPQPPSTVRPEPPAAAPPPKPAPPPKAEPTTVAQAAEEEDEAAPTVMLRAGAGSTAGQGVFKDAKAPASDPPPRGDGLREDQWLYLLEGAQRGPVDVEDLVDLVLTSIPEDTKVWHPGLEGWVRANDVRQIAEEIPPPLPVPGAATGFGDEEMPDFDTVPPQFRTALIADEDEAFRKYLAMPLAAQGFTIHEAADGSAAWQLAVQNRPWLILADVNMPEVDGFEFCQRVRNHPLLSHTPLLFISGSDKYKERYRALQIGADDFLTKQTKIREILMRIQLLLTKYSDLGAEQEQATAAEGDAGGIFQGRVEVFGAPALLQMCAQGRLTGIFTALAEDAENTAAVMGFREGEIISATVGAEQGLEGAYAFLAWPKGSFKFTPGEPGEGEPLAQSVEHLLLEGCRLLDESQQDGGGDGEEASFI